MWTVYDSRKLAAERVGGMGRRWHHLRAVGHAAEDLADQHPEVSVAVVSAAWLHDIGYAPSLYATGFHPLDGARFLRSAGVPEPVVALVAHHTGASYEAAERGLSPDFQALPEPDSSDLSVLDMLDLGTSPDGAPILDSVRLAEILRRYPPDDPVRRAILRSGPGLLAASARAKARLGLPNVWPLTVRKCMG